VVLTAYSVETICVVLRDEANVCLLIQLTLTVLNERIKLNSLRLHLQHRIMTVSVFI